MSEPGMSLIRSNPYFTFNSDDPGSNDEMKKSSRSDQASLRLAGVSNSEEGESVAVRRLRREDLRAVTAVHLEQYSDSRSSRLGEPFVRKMYTWFLTNQPDLALVATLDGRLVGFAVGAIGGYGRRIFHYALPELAWGVICHPILIFRRGTFHLWTSFLRAFAPEPQANVKADLPSPQLMKASLASVAVSKAAQGRGVGKALMRAFEDAAKQQGTTLLGLSVKRGNVAARHLYESCGWQLLHEDLNLDSAYYSKRLAG